MEKVAVGINGDGFKLHFVGNFNHLTQVVVQGGFAAQNHQVCLSGFVFKKSKPVFNGLYIKRLVSMLVRVDIAMGARKVAFC